MVGCTAMCKKNAGNLEIERKFLIRFPDIDILSNCDGVRVLEIVQTYLESPGHITSRVRSISENGGTKYIRTDKIRITNISCIEDEHEITKQQYDMLLERKDTSRKPIEKTRYKIPTGKHTAEIDIYPFWRDRAVLEIELKRENEEFVFPDFVEVIKEVTNDRRYKNAYLAKSVVNEEIGGEQE